jgi:hypothetical protein
MASQRAKGQDVVLSVLVDGALQVRIDTIQSAQLEYEMDILEEGYLGESSDRPDSIYKLTRVSLKGHCNSQAYFELADAIVNKARRRAGSPVRIDVVGTFYFPNGDAPTLILPDVHFGSIPLDIGGRDAYVEFSLEGKCSDPKRV